MGCFNFTNDGALSDQELSSLFLASDRYINPKLEKNSLDVVDPWIGITPVGEDFQDFTGDIHSKMQFYDNIGEQRNDLSRYQRVQTGLNALSGEGLCGPHDPCAQNAEETIKWGVGQVEWGMYRLKQKTPKLCVESLRTRKMVIEFLNSYVEALKKESRRLNAEFVRNHYNVYSQKLVLTSKGIEESPDITSFPKIVDINNIATLNAQVLRELHGRIWNRAGTEHAAGSSNGAPLYYLGINQQTMYDAMFYDKAMLDLTQWSGTGAKNEFVKSMMTRVWQDMFIPMMIKERRFKLNVDGTIEEVFPYIINIPVPGGIGTTYTVNSDYENAELGAIDVFPNGCWTIHKAQKRTSLGGGSQFGSQGTFFEDWRWFADKCEGNEDGLIGYWYSTFKAAMEPNLASQYTYQVLFRRINVRHKVSYPPVITCNTDETDCGPTIESVGCPCPLITGPITRFGTKHFIPMSPNFAGVAEEEISLELVTGGSVDLTIDDVIVEADGTKVIEVTSAVPLTVDCVLGINCKEARVCSSRVDEGLTYCDVRTGTSVTVRTIDGALRVAVGQSVTVFYADGTSSTQTVSAIGENGLSLTLNIAIATLCAKKGIKSICVPTSTDATCPGCTEPTPIFCEEEPEGPETLSSHAKSSGDCGCGDAVVAESPVATQAEQAVVDAELEAPKAKKSKKAQE